VRDQSGSRGLVRLVVRGECLATNRIEVELTLYLREGVALHRVIAGRLLSGLGL
jgi:hypothetical protein